LNVANLLYVVHCYLDASWLSNVHVNLPAVKRRSATLGARRTVKKQWQVRWYIIGISRITAFSGWC